MSPNKFLTAGASGAVLALVAINTQLQPDMKLQLIFLPGFEFSAQDMLGCIVAFDLVGLLFLRSGMLDHGAHLMGVGLGCAYFHQGHSLVMQYEEAVIRQWRVLRNNALKFRERFRPER